jgi:hypothetical protein
MKKEYIVFNQRLAGKLMSLGFVLKRMEKTTRDNSNRNIFIFNHSDDLVKVVQEFKNE